MKQVRGQKIDIIVGIPTYNEADSIENTVRKIDSGLTEYFPKYNCLIVNLDSKSTDGTNSVFLATRTKTAKVSLTSKEVQRGKGANIFLLLKFGKKLGAKYIATIDADIATITEKWPKLLLDPIIRKNADFVTPIYTRNRYEGNTTNHFCFPLLYAWFGQTMKQPIGGDFAMNARFVDHVLRQPRSPEVYLYGIDIFLSVHAIGGKFGVKEVPLGRKIHKPSFDKIIPMFHQVAAVTVFVLSRYQLHFRQYRQHIDRFGRKRIDEFVRKPNNSQIVSLRKYALSSLRRLSFRDAYECLGVGQGAMERFMKDRSPILERDWIGILASLINFISRGPINSRTASRLAVLIAPFFFLRTLSYFRELADNLEPRNVDAIILRQAKELRGKIIDSR